MATTYTTNYNLGKQENHADKFDMEVLTDNADKIDAALTELQSNIDGKQATLTTAQLAAVNSGITSTDVEQIETNKNNILLSADQTTQYNIVPIKSTITTGNASVTATVAEDKTITITITGTTSSAIGFEISDNFVIDTTAQYVMTGNPSAGAIRLILQQAESPYNWIQQQYNNQAATATPSVSLVRYYVYIYANSSGTITLKPMLIPKSIYNAGFTNYQPYALPNTAITTALKECVDNGAKNLLNNKAVSSSIYTVNADKTVTANGTGNATITLATLTASESYALNGMVLSGCPSGGSDSSYKLIIQRNSSPWNVYTRDLGSGAIISGIPEVACVVLIQVMADTTVSNLVFKPMICTQADWNVSHTYFPYAMSNAELTAAIQALQAQLANQ